MVRAPGIFRWRVEPPCVLFRRMIRLRSPLLLLSGLVLFVECHTGWAATISIQPVADTTLIQLASGNNLGGAGYFNAGTSGNGGYLNRALIRYDLSSIPAGSVITSVSITFDVIRQAQSGSQNSFFSLRRVFQSWGEGVQIAEDGNQLGMGAPAGPGEATWDSRFGGGAIWSQPGGAEGVDYSGTLSATALSAPTGEQMYFGPTPALMADVQTWVGQPELNFGWMLMTESEGIERTARMFASRESGFGPTLTIEFSPVPEPGVWAFAGLAALSMFVGLKRRRSLR
jgi:hypothetical protein